MIIKDLKFNIMKDEDDAVVTGVLHAIREEDGMILRADLPLAIPIESATKSYFEAVFQQLARLLQAQADRFPLKEVPSGISSNPEDEGSQ